MGKSSLLVILFTGAVVGALLITKTEMEPVQNTDEITVSAVVDLSDPASSNNTEAHGVLKKVPDGVDISTATARVVSKIEHSAATDSIETSPTPQPEEVTIGIGSEEVEVEVIHDILVQNDDSDPTAIESPPQQPPPGMEVVTAELEESERLAKDNLQPQFIEGEYDPLLQEPIDNFAQPSRIPQQSGNDLLQEVMPPDLVEVEQVETANNPVAL